MNKIRTLIVDDDENIVHSVRLSLGMHDIEVEAVEPRKAPGLAAGGAFDLLLLDVYLGSENGIDILKQIVSLDPDFPVIMISGLADMDEAIEAIKLGAYDFIEKPLKPERLLVSVQNAARYGRIKKLREEIPFVFTSPEMVRIAERARKVANTDTTVLITGESGTGKEVLANYIHAHSRRRDEVIVKLNCSAIPESLIESELFGHKKGSFTGAVSDYPGKIQGADGGTLFLDEIGELPPSMQVKLLRFLENRELQRVGEYRYRQVDVRIITATNRDLVEEMKREAFREDLFYRLNVFPLSLPPLRDRREEIVPLAEHFLSEFALGMGIPVPAVTPAAAELLRSLPYEGNVRELRTVIERILILMSGVSITEENVKEAVTAGRKDTGDALFLRPMPLHEAKRRMELDYIRTQIAAAGGSVRKAAENLGVLPNNLSRRLKQLEEQIGAPGD
jgi:DNA-binding NtrC family response regulator